MSTHHEERELTRDVQATLIPHGDPYTLDKGAKVTITHRLGGNFTVMTLNGMYRISAADADSLGEDDSQAPEDDCTDAEPADEDSIRDALRSVFDPEIPVNVVDLGLIYKINIDEEEEGKRVANIDMTLTAPGCGMGPVIAEDCKGKVIKLAGIDEANVEIVWDPPWTQDLISETGKMELGMI
jgi:probable FeS assembly SUF system protein SufT